MSRKPGKKPQYGFTLIELMIVISIIGILAAIAIPQYAAFKTRGFNASSEADLRNAASAQEAHYVDFQSYANAADALTGSAYGLFTSENVALSIAGTTSGYTMTAYHGSGDKTWTIAGPGGSVSG